MPPEIKDVSSSIEGLRGFVLVLSALSSHLASNHVRRQGIEGPPFALEGDRVGGRRAGVGEDVEVVGMVARDLEWMVETAHMFVKK